MRSKKRLSSIAGAVALGGAASSQSYMIDGVEYQSVSEAQAYELDPETGNALVTIGGETVLVEQGDYVVVDGQILFTSEAVSVLASASGIGLLSLLILSSQDDNGNVQQGGNPPPPPVPNSPPLITSPSNPSINENLNEVFTPTLSDAEQDPLTLSIVGGADAAFFSVSNNTYFFTAAPDYENPLDADADNVYELELEVSDGNGGTGSQSVSVSVLNTNDNAPVFTSATSIDVASGSSATGYTAIATDADGDVVTYSLSGGPDQSALLIDGTTGVLSFATAIDYANPTDNDLDNTYEVVISASGNGVSETLTVSINVQNPAANVLYTFNADPNWTSYAVGLANSSGGFAIAGSDGSNIDGVRYASFEDMLNDTNPVHLGFYATNAGVESVAVRAGYINVGLSDGRSRETNGSDIGSGYTADMQFETTSSNDGAADGGLLWLRNASTVTSDAIQYRTFKADTDALTPYEALMTNGLEGVEFGAADITGDGNPELWFIDKADNTFYVFEMNTLAGDELQLSYDANASALANETSIASLVGSIGGGDIKHRSLHDVDADGDLDLILGVDNTITIFEFFV